MNFIHTSALVGLALALGMTIGTAQADASGTGVINSVDTEQGIVNLTHGPIPALSWPEMTMDLPVTEAVDLSGIDAGDSVGFQVELGDDDVYRITRLDAAD